MIVDDEIIKEEEMFMIQYGIIGDENFSYKLSQSTSYQFRDFSHILARRISDSKDFREDTDVVSEKYDFFKNIIDRFSEKHGIKNKRVLRAAINVTFENSRYETGEPHVDFKNIPHNVFIIYLNEFDEDSKFNNTIIFEKKYFEGEKNPLSIEECKKLNILKEVTPKIGRILCFDGSHYHTIRWPKSGDMRFICVFNVEI